jgi:ferrochelatase
MNKPRKKLAVVLFNLGGPDRPESIRPFLLNLFRDPAILRVPWFVRFFLARIIAYSRTKPATEIYAQLGGRSPLLGLTRRQADALQTALSDYDTKCFIAMRYWHPMSLQTAREVRDFAPDDVVLLPLYPHFSTTTTGSSLTAWREAAATAGLTARTAVLCCYPDEPAFIDASATLLREHLLKFRQSLPDRTPVRILFSAHGLPEKIVRGGDPYQYQIERGAAALLAALGEDVDSVVCYQSRVTPVKWIGPSTEEEIERAGHDKVAVIVVPIAFVSDHSETLVELDLEYAALARKHDVPAYSRVPVQNDYPPFIDALANLVRQSLANGPGLHAANRRTICPHEHTQCPCRLAGLVA